MKLAMQKSLSIGKKYLRQKNVTQYRNDNVFPFGYFKVTACWRIVDQYVSIFETPFAFIPLALQLVSVNSDCLHIFFLEIF